MMPSTMSNRSSNDQSGRRTYSMDEIAALVQRGWTITFNFDSGIHFCTAIDECDNEIVRTSRASLSSAISQTLGEIGRTSESRQDNV